jgi:hypothetical protein
MEPEGLVLCSEKPKLGSLMTETNLICTLTPSTFKILGFVTYRSHSWLIPHFLHIIRMDVVQIPTFRVRCYAKKVQNVH